MKKWFLLSLLFSSAAAIAVVLTAVVVVAVACDKGCVDYEGVCACDAPSESAASVQPSDEKPSRHPEPAWQRGEVKAIDLPSTAADDAKQDAERAKADQEGKLAAGIGKVAQ